jgi:hypothetical protein
MNTTMDSVMTNFIRNWRAASLALTMVAALAMTSCSQQSPPPPPAQNTPPIGRYQIATISEGDRGATLILLDTTTGETWLYHAPQGPLFNGFWGDIPRVTSPSETWRQAFQTLIQPAPTNRPATTPITPAP